MIKAITSGDLKLKFKVEEEVSKSSIENYGGIDKLTKDAYDFIVERTTEIFGEGVLEVEIENFEVEVIDDE